MRLAYAVGGPWYASRTNRQLGKSPRVRMAERSPPASPGGPDATLHVAAIRSARLRAFGLDRQEHFVRSLADDLNAVVDAARFRSFALLESSQGCAIAIAYAARYPERVTHLMLYGGFVLGRLKRDLTNQQREEAHTLI